MERPSYMPLWDDTWEALLLVEDPTERWQVLEALRKFGRDGTQPEGLNNLQMAVFIAARHGVKFKKKSGAPEGNDNASKNNIETTLKQCSDNVETIGIQSETIGNNPLKNNNSNKNNKREDLKEELDDDDNKRAREEISSSSSVSNSVVTSQPLTDFDKLCDEMIPSNGTYASQVKMMNPSYNVSDEKFNGWVEKFRHYKHTIGDDGLKSRQDVRRNFINWLKSQVKAEKADASNNPESFSKEQEDRIASASGIPYPPTAVNDLKKYIVKCKVSPETAVAEYEAARKNGYGHYEIQAIIRGGNRIPQTKKQQ